ncbi:MAG: hypothetical protein GY851_10070 [bacterium]|nr:hypothetical protein [bacterium]
MTSTLFRLASIALILSLFTLNTSAAPFDDFVTASSVHSIEYPPHCAVDGSAETRWASTQAKGEAWLRIDLGRKVKIGGVRINWERACATEYEVQVSTDGEKWRRLYRVTDGKPGVRELTGNTGKGRYIRVLCLKANQYNLYSIWEITLLDEESARTLGDNVSAIHKARKEEELRRSAGLRQALTDTGTEEMVYATRAIHPDGHWYANISYYAESRERKTYVKGTGLYRLHVESAAVTPLVEDPEGTIRDPAVDYDGHTILFSWRKGGTDNFHLYRIDADGTDLTQLTSGGYDDIEGAWLPGGGIIFVSSRSRRWVNCWLTQVATIHRCDRDGGNIEPLSANLEHDNTPWPLPDGRILYMRWEYVDRSQVDYHHLWTMNPDGTGQMIYYGNLHPGGVYIDAKPIPGTNEVLMINSPGHGAKEHAGHVAIVTPESGPDNRRSLRNLTEGGFRDPYPLSRDTFLAARGRDLVIMDREGLTATLHRLDDADRARQLHEPRPLIPRQREHVIPPRGNDTESTGRLMLADVHMGRNMTGVEKGDITSLLVVESLPKPINYTGGMDPLTYGGSFSLERALGTVPVEKDGSAFIEVPANRSLFFVAMDADGNSVKRMQSFFSVMPGETTSCVGCHEQRTRSVTNPGRQQLLALLRPPSTISPLDGMPDVFDFPRDVQPILDTHCVPCHDYVPHPGAKHGPRSGGMVLTGDHGPMFSHSYVTLTVHKQFVDGRDQARSNYAPRTIGAGASPIIHKVTKRHHGVDLTAREIDTLRYWIETGAPYPGTYGALGGGSIGGYHENQLVETDAAWPESRAASAAIRQRCDTCHKDAMHLPKTLCDENGLSFWRPDWSNPRLPRTRHFMFNLSRPKLSMMLLAPLAKEEGGYGLCLKDGKPVFADAADPDYAKILAMCAAGKRRLNEIKRFDMPGFQPPGPYIREMQRYAVLPDDLAPDTPVDPYACDQAYWSSFYPDVALKHPAYAMSQPNAK